MAVAAVVRYYLLVFLRGGAMGAADVVPGVSGGTIAFITGIYERLIESLRRFDLSALRVLRAEGVAAVWRHVNGNFLLALFAGILTSVLSLARIIEHLMAEQPILVWSFFFGLVAASFWHVSRRLGRWGGGPLLALLLGSAFALAVTLVRPAQLPDSPGFLFLSGAIAICAMILPGVSGSFILLLLGMYTTVLRAVRDFDWLLLGSFVAGCACGLLAFSHVLSWLFRRYHDLTLATLAGFLLGSLQMLWPWKRTMSYYQDRHGELQPLVEENLGPGQYAALLGEDPRLWSAVAAAALAVGLVLALEFVGRRSVLPGRI